MTEDYQDIPTCLRRRNGLPIDVMADLFGFGYADEFVQHVAAIYSRFMTTRKPASLKRHADVPELQDLLDLYYASWRACCEAKQRWGSRSHPEATPIYDLQRHYRRLYQLACLEAGVAFATV